MSDPIYKNSPSSDVEITYGFGRGKDRFGAIHEVRLVCAKGAKCNLDRCSRSRPSNYPGRCSINRDCLWAVMVYIGNTQHLSGS